MKKIAFLFLITFYFIMGIDAQIEVPSNVDSLASVIGKVKTVSVANDTTIVTNDNDEQFILVGENVGALVNTLLTGYTEIKENVETNTQGRPIDWILELVKWLLGGSLTSVIAYGSRSITGIKNIFAGIVKNRRLVVGIAGAVALGYLVLTGGDLTSLTFWASWGATWFAFAMFAIGLYDTIFSRLKKTPKTIEQQAIKVAEATAIVKEAGGKVEFS